MTPWPNAFSVEGTYVSVVPLTFDHQADLESAAADGELHRFWYSKIPKPDQVNYEIGRRLDLREKCSMMPFAIIDQ